MRNACSCCSWSLLSNRSLSRSLGCFCLSHMHILILFHGLLLWSRRNRLHRRDVSNLLFLFGSLFHQSGPLLCCLLINQLLFKVSLKYLNNLDPKAWWEYLVKRCCLICISINEGKMSTFDSIPRCNTGATKCRVLLLVHTFLVAADSAGSRRHLSLLHLSIMLGVKVQDLGSLHLCNALREVLLGRGVR